MPISKSFTIAASLTNTSLEYSVFFNALCFSISFSKSAISASKSFLSFFNSFILLLGILPSFMSRSMSSIATCLVLISPLIRSMFSCVFVCTPTLASGIASLALDLGIVLPANVFSATFFIACLPAGLSFLVPTTAEFLTSLGVSNILLNLPLLLFH